MDAVELQEWMTYYDSEPWGPRRADWNAAMMCHVIAAVNGISTEPADFLPRFGPADEPVKRCDEDLLRLAKKANALMHGKIRTDGE
jgi:hypothetical protein